MQVQHWLNIHRLQCIPLISYSISGLGVTPPFIYRITIYSITILNTKIGKSRIYSSKFLTCLICNSKILSGTIHNSIIFASHYTAAKSLISSTFYNSKIFGSTIYLTASSAHHKSHIYTIIFWRTHKVHSKHLELQAHIQRQAFQNI